MMTYCVHWAAGRPWVKHMAHVKGKRNGTCKGKEKYIQSFGGEN